MEYAENYNQEEPSHLTKNEKSWTKKDLLLLVFGSLISLGDGVQIYLPGVISQLVSCELQLSPFQGGALDCILYLAIMIALVVADRISGTFGRRNVTLFSLYTSVLSTVLFAAVASYETLLLSRANIGFSVGLNFALHCEMIAQQISSKKVLEDTMLIISVVCTAGGIWSAALGYLLLDLLGWKIFTLLIVLPISLLPIFMLHNCFGESPSCNLKSVEDESEKSVPKFISRAIKLVLFFTVTSLQGWLSIILVPEIIQQQNIRQAEASSSCYLTVTQTTEFLFLFLLLFFRSCHLYGSCGAVSNAFHKIKTKGFEHYIF